MAKKKKGGRRNRRSNPYIDSTVNMTTGIVGLNVAGSVGAGLGGLPGTIINQGAMPIASLGMLEEAANYGKKRRR